jgi:hypothetical protein
LFNYVLCVIILISNHFASSHLPNMLSVLLRFTNSDYPFGIFKLFCLIMFSALYLNNNLRLIISIIEHSIDHDPHEESAYIYEYKQHTKRKLIDWCLAMCTKVIIQKERKIHLFLWENENSNRRLCLW